MPTVKRLIPIDKRRAIIDYCISYKGWSKEDVQNELDISRDARIARMKDPSLFTLGNIQRLIHGVPLSPSQISIVLGGVVWDCSGEQMQLKGGFV